MEIRLKLGLGGRAFQSVTASLGVALRRVGQIRLPNLRERMPVDMFGSDYLPYEAEKTYRTIMIDYERNRGQILVEVHKHLT